MSNSANRQLSDYLKSISAFKQVNLPAKGWVRAVRDGLLMSRRQLADRLGLSTSRIQRLEQDEVSGAVTIKTMRRTAEALDCVFVYAIIPRESIEETVNTQAHKKASKYLQKTNHSMLLEDQAVNEDSYDYALDSLSAQIINKSSRTLWDDK
jgi:predicted DNA-binding mobile mystery protein A